VTSLPSGARVTAARERGREGSRMANFPVP
jgi:hypothetical protein